MIKLPIALAISSIVMLYFFVDINTSDWNNTVELPKKFIELEK